jgi:hypothetical protein
MHYMRLNKFDSLFQTHPQLPLLVVPLHKLPSSRNNPHAFIDTQHPLGATSH